MNRLFSIANEDRIPYIISSLRQAVYRFVESEMKNAGLHGLMHTHCAILYALYASNGSMRMTDIAILINRTKATVSVLVDFLQKKGYIEKHKSSNDSREIFVQLTHKGYEIQKTIETMTKKLKRIAFKHFNASEIDMLVTLLSRLQENLR